MSAAPNADDTFPAYFIVDNLAIGLNVIRGSFKACGITRLTLPPGRGSQHGEALRGFHNVSGIRG